MLQIKQRNEGFVSPDGAIRISKARILAVANISGEKPPFSQFVCDVGVKLTLDIGRDFTPELVIAGAFDKSETGEVKGWGRAFPVQRLLQRVGLDNEQLDNDKLTQAILDGLVGKELWRLSYVSGKSATTGKVRWSDWMVIGDINKKPELLYAEFQKSIARGYPKNYHPETLNEEVAFPEVTIAGEKDAGF